MPSQRQDYILREIELIGRVAARLRRKRTGLDEKDEADLNEALLLAMHVLEKTFGMPATDFLRLSADEQIACLRKGTDQAGGNERCLTYASLLREMAELYTQRRREDLALGARQLGLYVALAVGLDQPTDATAARALVRELVTLLGDAELPAPTLELLEKFEPDASRSSGG